MNLCYRSLYHRVAILRVFTVVQRLRWKLLSLNHVLCGCTENRFVLSFLALNPISMSI